VKTWCAALLAAAAATADPVAEVVVQALDLARSRAGAPALERRPELDRVAAARAAEVASLPHEKRMGKRRPLAEVLEEANAGPYAVAREHVEMNRGHADPAAAFLTTWRAYDEAWAAVMDPALDAVGVATFEALDGFRVLVAVTVRDVRADLDLEALARRTVEEVNRVRAERGLTALRGDPRLAEVARRHSEEMARLGALDHDSPVSGGTARRVETAGIRYRRLAENLQTNNDPDDPVAVAVRSWMNSPGHRANMLDPGYSRTGVGVAVDERGDYYFTQLFMLDGG